MCSKMLLASRGFSKIRASRPDVNSDILFIRPDGIEFRRRNLRNYIMRQWIVREPQGVYIGGNARRKSLETALHNDPYDKPGTDRVVEHSRRVGLQRYLLTDSTTALLGLQRYIRAYKSLCDSHQIEPPREFIEMICSLLKNENSDSRVRDCYARIKIVRTKLRCSKIK